MDLDFLDGPVPAAPAVAPQAEVAPVVDAPQADPASGGPARGPDGKFVSPETEAPLAPVVEQAPAAPPVQSGPPPGYVPIGVVEAIRKEMQALKNPPPAPAPQPDRYEDPEGYEQFREQQIEQRLYAQALSISERFAVQAHGKEAVSQAVQWGTDRCDKDPVFNAAVRNSPDPIGYVVEQHMRDTALSRLGDPKEVEAFLAWKAVQAGQAPPVAPAAPGPVPSPVVAPPRSLASATSAGGAAAVPVGPGQAYDAVFK